MCMQPLPVHIKLKIKRKAVPSCLLPRLPVRVLPPLLSPPLCRLLLGFQRVFSAKQQGLIRLSDVRRVRPTRWGLLLRPARRSTNAKKKKEGRKAERSAKIVISMHIFGAFISPVFGAIGGVTFELAKPLSLYNVHTA